MRPGANGLPERLHDQARAAQLLESGEPAAAESLLRRLLADRRGDAETLRLLGIALLKQRRAAEALVLLEQARAAMPARAVVHMNLGSVRRALGDLAGALDDFQRACDLEPLRASGWFNLAKALKADARIEAALEAVQRCLALQPTHVQALVLSGELLKAVGDIGAATRAFRQAAALDATAANAWWGLANLRVVEFSAAEVEAMQAAHATLPPGESRCQLAFALARACEQSGALPTAADWLRSANAGLRKLRPWDRQLFAKLAQATLSAFPTVNASIEPAGAEVILIVGLPRSGTTLVEQILAAHPDVAAASELPDLAAVIVAEGRRLQLRFPQWANAASAADWARLGQDYLRRTQRWLGTRQRFTDKQPDNFLYVGALLQMLPAARVVSCIRDPRDTALSCFQQYFALGQGYAQDLGDLADYQRQFRQLSSHWCQHYPQQVIEVVYEDLVMDPESQIARLLAHLQLKPDPRCLRPHEVQRIVRTASAGQVREPLDRRGVARWQQYRALLPELQSLFEPLVLA